MIGEKFAGANPTATNSRGSAGTPPDTMGAIGPNHYVEWINGVFAIYNKGTATLATPMIADFTFWTTGKVGFSAATVADGLSDTRLLFDVPTRRSCVLRLTTTPT